jgi:hypothetical protein
MAQIVIFQAIRDRRTNRIPGFADTAAMQHRIKAPHMDESFRLRLFREMPNRKSITHSPECEIKNLRPIDSGKKQYAEK